MTRDMTTGSPLKVILLFTLPMLLGNVFQQFYNIIDSVIIGNFDGANSLAAVGSGFPITLIPLAVATGLSMGCSVVIGQLFGAKQHADTKKAIYTTLLFSLMVSVGILAICLLTLNWLLTLIQTPENIFDNTYLYLFIYFLGIPFAFLYNALSSISNAMGDSKTPLIYLVLATLVNIGLDLLFVIQFRWSVFGVAFATAIAQFVSAIGLLLHMFKRVKLLHYQKGDVLFDRSLLRGMVRYAIPSTIQQVFISMSMISIQGLVNGFGTKVIAGISAAHKIDLIAMQPATSFGNALSSYAAQNMGAGKIDRIWRGYRAGLIVSGVFSALITVFIFIFGSSLIGAFMDSNLNVESIATGVEYIRVVSLFYVIMSIMAMANGAVRGVGDIRSFMTSTMMNFTIRVVAAYSLAPFIGSAAISWSMPIGWIVAGSFVNLTLLRGKWVSKGYVQQKYQLEETRSASG